MGVHEQVGTGRSPLKTGTITNTNTELGTPLDLERPYNFISIGIADCSNVVASSFLRLNIGDTESDDMKDFFRHIDGSQDISEVPSSGAFRIVVPVLGARRVNPKLSIAVTGDVVIEVYGIEPVIDS